ncbi:MAG: alpha/beta fold hydrolase [Chloroflexi bacterium]|nr:alpha/beta fold hydrolase [Chloroflexota bacterium]
MSHHDFDYPDSYVIINGHRMHYFHSGTEEERAVVMLHGNYSSSYGYRHFFPYLVGAGWRCLALDSIGFGGSDKPDDVDTHTFDFHSDNLEIFIREIGLRDVVLVGHEWGGLVALDYTINRMDNTRALVLMNSGAFLTNRPSRIRGLLNRSVLGDVLVRRLNLPLRDGSLKGKVYYKNNLDRQVKAHYRSPFPSYASRAGILGFLRMVPQSDNEYISKRIKTIQNNLPQLRVPTLLVGSKGDPVFGEAEAKVLRALIPNAELRVLDDGGHLLQEDRPDLLSSWIVDFLGRLAPV